MALLEPSRPDEYRGYASQWSTYKCMALLELSRQDEYRGYASQWSTYKFRVCCYLRICCHILIYTCFATYSSQGAAAQVLLHMYVYTHMFGATVVRGYCANAACVSFHVCAYINLFYAIFLNTLKPQ